MAQFLSVYIEFVIRLNIKMPRTRRTQRQIHPNLSRQFPNNLEFIRAVRNFDAENLRRRNPSQNNNRRFAPYVVQRQNPGVDLLQPAVSFKSFITSLAYLK